MLTNYYTLRALVREWKGRINGAVLSAAYSQARGECTLVFEAEPESHAEPEPGDESSRAPTAPETTWSLKISVQAPLRYLFMNPGTSRAKKNVAELFESIRGVRAESISIADGDRLLDIDFSGGRCFRIVPFGPRANIYLLGSDGRVEDRFRSEGVEPGDLPPEASARSTPKSVSEMVSKLGDDGLSLGKRILRCYPTLGKVPVFEACRRAGLDESTGGLVKPLDQERLFESIQGVIDELLLPAPRIFWEGDLARILSLIPLRQGTDLREEVFESVDETVRIYTRRMLGQTAFARRADPIKRVLRSRSTKAQRSRDRMEQELMQESRADNYEHWAHLLMAAQHIISPGVESAELDDIINQTGIIRIPLVPGLTAVQNAERYYEKAKETRRSRASSEQRMIQLESAISRLYELTEEISALKTPAEIDGFRKKHQDSLAELSSQGTGVDVEIPFRRYPLSGGYEVWVGRNALQNDRLTLRFARKYDLWLHARGVAGSHTVLRLPGRNHHPPAAVIETAAAIAAYHSKARTSSLAPVIVTERKYVRKPRKSRPGTVIVEREKVILVKPGLP